MPTDLEPARREIAHRINRALEASDVIAACQAIGDATRLYNISDIAKRAGVERPSIYRSFGGRRTPNLTTLLSVLDAMGFQLKVAQRRGKRVNSAKPRT
jgi:probable addiction module antidote protein